MLNMNTYGADLRGGPGRMGMAANHRKTLVMNSSAAIQAWVDKFNGTFTRASTMMVPDKDGIFRVTPVDAPAIFGGEWDAANGKWLAAEGAGLAVWPSVTNAMPADQYREFSGWSGVAAVVKNQTGIDGVPGTATTLTDDLDGNYGHKAYPFAVLDDTEWASVLVPVKKDGISSRVVRIDLDFIGGATPLYHNIHLRTDTGDFLSRMGNTDDDAGVIDPGGDYWLVWVASQNNGTGNTTGQIVIYPAVGPSLDVQDMATQGGCVIDWVGLFMGQVRPCPFPVPGGETLAAQRFDFENRKLVADAMGSAYVEGEVLISNPELLSNNMIIACGNPSYSGSPIKLSGSGGAQFYDITNYFSALGYMPLSGAFKLASSWHAERGEGKIFQDGGGSVREYDGDFGSPTHMCIGSLRDRTRLFAGILKKIVFDYKHPQTTEFWEERTL